MVTSRPRRSLREKIEKLENDAIYASRKSAEWENKANKARARAEHLRKEIADAAAGP